MMQAAITTGFVVSLAVVRDTSSEEKAASMLGYMAMAWAVAPMLGPMLGGVLDELFGWRASFVMFAMFGATMLCICWVDLRETNNQRSATLYQQMKSYPQLLRSHRFWGYALCMAFSTGAFYAFIGGAPFVAKWIFNISTAELGFYMGTITAGFVLGSFLSGRFSGNARPTTTMIAGRIIACAGLCAGLMVSFYSIQNQYLFFGACVCVGIGNGLTMPTSNVGVMSVIPSLSGSAAGLSGALTVGGGALMATVTGAVLTESNAAVALLGIMLLSSALGLLGALYVRWQDRSKVT